MSDLLRDALEAGGDGTGPPGGVGRGLGPGGGRRDGSGLGKGGGRPFGRGRRNAAPQFTHSQCANFSNGRCTLHNKDVSADGAACPDFTPAASSARETLGRILNGEPIRDVISEGASKRSDWAPYYINPEDEDDPQSPANLAMKYLKASPADLMSIDLGDIRKTVDEIPGLKLGKSLYKDRAVQVYAATTSGGTPCVIIYDMGAEVVVVHKKTLAQAVDDI